MRRLKLLSQLLTSTGTLCWIPAPAHACGVCVLPDPRSAGAYIGMTLMMIGLPLGLIGGLAYWLCRHR